MWNENEHTYEERSEYFKALVLQLEQQVEELTKENDKLRAQLCYNRNPEDSYRENFSYIGIKGIKTY